MDIAKSIKAINPTAEFKYSNEDFSTLELLNGTTPISKSDIEAKMAELQAEHDAQEYARNRQAEYPSINDLIVALWENVVEERAASVIELEAKRQDVKTKYPKS